MIYIIQGQEQCFIKDKLKEITSSSESEVVYFDGSDKNFSIGALLEACEGNSLFSQGSIVLVDQPFFLIRKSDEKQLQPLLDNFSAKLKVYKAIAKNAQVITLNSLDYKNFNNYVRSRLNEEKVDISSDAAYQLNSICKRNATLFNQNIEILKLYPGKIDLKAVNKLCTASDENDSFELINALTAKDVSKAIYLERKMMTANDSILSVIGLLANQLRFLYQIAYLSSKGKNRKQILDETGVNEYRLNKAFESLRNLRKEQIISLLAKLSDLDISCKSDSSLPDASRFELFILEFLKRG